MATSYPFHLSSASIQTRRFPKMALRFQAPILPGLKVSLGCNKEHRCCLSMKLNRASSSLRPHIPCAINMEAGQPGNPEKINLHYLMDKVKFLWDKSPQPVKSFPWKRALENFIQLVLDLILTVVKYLSVPLLAVSSLSEMSYCAHQRKLFLVPFPLLIGVAVAGVLKETALEMSPLLSDAEVPWHLIAIAIFFTMLKLPGPHYPYWLRLFVPHLANGALLRTLWFTILWYRRPRKVSAMTIKHDPIVDSN